MPPHDVAVLMHLVGFLAGAALYGILFALVVRRLASEDDRLPLLTAILGLIWNLTALAAYGMRVEVGVRSEVGSDEIRLTAQPILSSLPTSDLTPTS